MTPPLANMRGGLKNQIFARMALNHFHFHFCQMAYRPPFPLLSQIAKKFFFNDEGHLKDILSLTLTLGWKNGKRPSGPIELDLEAGNLVSIFFHMDELLPHPKWRAFLNNIYQ